MNKKFLSAILFGALMVTSTGTFVSCKDYDDDIKDLQEQIDKQKTDLSDKVTAIESSIASLQTAQTGLEAKIAEVKDAAEKAALEAQKAAIAAAAEELAGVKAELEAAITKLQTATDEEIQAVKGDITEIEASIAEVNGKINALQAFQTTTEETLAALAEADTKLAGTLTALDAEVKANKVAIGKNESAIDAQKKALEAYILSNDEAVAANKTAIEGILVTLGEQQEILDGLKAFDVKETQDAIATIESKLATMATELTTLSNQISAINSNLDLVWAAIAKGVTHVSLYASANGAIINGENVTLKNADIELLSAKSIADWTFGEGMPGAVKFTKGERSKLRATLVVRVSPVTATLSAGDIHFISTQLDGTTPVDLVEKGLVKVTGIEPYKGEVLSRAGISATGLWAVNLEVGDNYDETAYDKATTVVKSEEKDKLFGNPDYNVVTEEKSVLFAVKVADTDNAARAAVSEYALAFTKDNSEAKSVLDFNVWAGTDGWKVANLHNRYGRSEEDATTAPAEYKWAGIPAATPIYEGALANVAKDASDNRQSKCLNTAGTAVAKPVVSSTANSFKVKLADDMLASATHFYVVLDKERALSSDDSEIKTWTKLYEPNITGINTVYDVKTTGGEATIGFTINDINDVIGFRVYAVNSNGTLVDPDGRAFYVRVGAVADVISAKTTIIADANVTYDKNLSDKADVAAEMKDKYAEAKGTIASAELVTDKVYRLSGFWAGEPYNKDAFQVQFEMQDGSIQDITYFNSKDLKELAKVKSIYTTRTEDIAETDYVDDQVYNGTISFKNDKDVAIATLNVSMTKVVPTTLPAGTAWKENQLQADKKTYFCYVLPNAFTPVTATVATMKTNEMFNVDTKISNANKYTFFFTTNDPIVNRKVEGFGNTVLSLEKSKDEFAMIDDVTPYDVVVKYNYGKVSSKTPDQDIVIDNAADGWKAVYSNIYGKSYTFDWASEAYKKTAQSIKYGVDFKYTTGTTTVPLDKVIKGKSSYYAIYDELLADADGLKIVKEKCSFVTVSTGEESEYFEIYWNNNGKPEYLKALKKDSNITDNVPSILKITVLDCFGNERVIEMNMTVVPNVAK